MGSCHFLAVRDRTAYRQIRSMRVRKQEMKSK
jgi:hypothetical protein